MQAGAILLTQYTPASWTQGLPVAARMNDVRFKRDGPAGRNDRDGSRNDASARRKAWFLKAKVTCGGQVAARLEFACAIAPPTEDRTGGRLTTGEHAMDFLQLAGKSILVFGVANRKSVAFHIGRLLEEAGARVVYVVRSRAAQGVGGQNRQARRGRLRVRRGARGRDRAAARRGGPAARASFTAWCTRSRLPTTPTACKPFHETPKAAFLRAVDISCFSLVALANALQGPARPGRVGRGDFDFRPRGWPARTTASWRRSKRRSNRRWCFWPSRLPPLARALQCRGAGSAEDLGLGRHPGLRRFLSVCRASHAAQAGRADRGSGRRGRVPAQPAHQAASTPKRSWSTPACR